MFHSQGKGTAQDRCMSNPVGVLSVGHQGDGCRETALVDCLRERCYNFPTLGGNGCGSVLAASPYVSIPTKGITLYLRAN